MDNPGAEQTLLGSIIADNCQIAEVQSLIREDDFYSHANCLVWRAACFLFSEQKPINAVSLSERLIETKTIDEVKVGYVYELSQCVIHGGNAAYYAGLVRDTGIKRRLYHAANEIAKLAKENAGSADEILDEAERTILEISRSGSSATTTDLWGSLKKSFARIDALKEGRSCGIMTGYADLDTLTGGLQNSELTIIAARPSLGKTSLGLGIAHKVAIECGQPVFFSSLEQSGIDLADRLLCLHAKVDSHRLRAGYLSPDDIQKLVDAGNQMNKGTFSIDDSSNQNMLRIMANARRLKKQKGIVLLVVDYLQLIEPADTKVNRNEQVALVSRRLKQLARELEIPVIALAQLNRESEHGSGREPRLSDLRDSGGIEADADTVILLWRSEPRDRPNVITAILAKQRNGPIGKVNLVFDNRYMRFENMAIEREAYGHTNGFAENH